MSDFFSEATISKWIQGLVQSFNVLMAEGSRKSVVFRREERTFGVFSLIPCAAGLIVATLLFPWTTVFGTLAALLAGLRVHLVNRQNS